MDLNLQEKVIVITGGTSGIGAELALAFAGEGCKVSICGRSEEKVHDLEEKFSGAGYQLHARVVDVRNLNALREYIEEVGNTFGRLDVFINNAGVVIRKPFEQFSEEEFENLVNTDFRAVYFGSAYASALMKRFGNGGVILNTSSFSSVIPNAGSALYCSVKAAVDNLTAALSGELAADNIRVVSIQPGLTVTPMTKEKCERNYERLVDRISMKRLATPDDIVGAYLFMASDRAAYINGISLPVAGGKLTVQNPHYSYGSKESNY